MIGIFKELENQEQCFCREVRMTDLETKGHSQAYFLICVMLSLYYLNNYLTLTPTRLLRLDSKHQLQSYLAVYEVPAG